LQCIVDWQRSPTFQKIVARLKAKNYRHVEADLEDAFKSIASDYEHANHADAIPGHNRTVWKYRAASKDIGKGSRYGFRIIAHYVPESNTLYPIFLYPKKEQENIAKGPITEATLELRLLLEEEKRKEAADGT
jgi:hypothetical protein